MSGHPLFNQDLISRYDKSGPRYTSYPTAPHFSDEFAEDSYRRVAESSNAAQEAESLKSLSLYFHIPFCNTVCFYCACNKIVTRDTSRAEVYLGYLLKEVELQAQLFDSSRKVDQLHWGGGTPTYLSNQQQARLMEKTKEQFSCWDDDSGEYSIELDPRTVTPDDMRFLRSIGFNRVSMGIQDFDPVVQKAVNRIQSEKETRAVIDAANQYGFRSVSVDLIYGLPFQTVATFSQTLDKVIEISPDRISVFNYAHLPELFKPQTRIKSIDLPSSKQKLMILKLIVEKLLDAGYVYIGMDHFAKPDDELAVAQKNGTLYRNFQGYSTHVQCDLVGMGVTAIGMIGSSYSQNTKSIDDYYRLLDENQLPIVKGFELSEDDLIRREAITQLICHGELNFSKMQGLFGVEVPEYFAKELQALEPLAEDGLVTIEPDTVRVTDSGMFLLRNICMVFDAYLDSGKQRFSKVI